MEVQGGGALMAAAIAHASTLRLDAAAQFVHSHPDPKDVPEDVKFKAKMVSEFNGLVGYEYSSEVVAQPVRLRVHVSYIQRTTESPRRMLTN